MDKRFACTGAPWNLNLSLYMQFVLLKCIVHKYTTCFYLLKVPYFNAKNCIFKNKILELLCAVVHRRPIPIYESHVKDYI